MCVPCWCVVFLLFISFIHTQRVFLFALQLELLFLLLLAAMLVGAMFVGVCYVVNQQFSLIQLEFSPGYVVVIKINSSGKTINGMLYMITKYIYIYNYTVCLSFLVTLNSCLCSSVIEMKCSGDERNTEMDSFC